MGEREGRSQGPGQVEHTCKEPAGLQEVQARRSEVKGQLLLRETFPQKRNKQEGSILYANLKKIGLGCGSQELPKEQASAKDLSRSS